MLASMKQRERILEYVGKARRLLPEMTEAQAHIRAAPGKWSKKEILGHLIDSAGNNHQRIVRAMCSAELVFPGYVQTEWVKAQDYENEDWASIVGLWEALNRHLAHIMERIPPEKMEVTCRIGDKDLTLGALASEYIQHMTHHLKQIDPRF